MYRAGRLWFLLLLLWSVAWVDGITNNANLIWYGSDGEPHDYHARQPIPEGLIKTKKIVVNQKFPILWQVRFASFDNLETLIIDDCGVSDIRPGTFKDLKPLTNLSLTRNDLKELKEGVFNTVEIKNLNFSHNKLQVIEPKTFDNMPILETVILDFNELKQWSGEWFLNCSLVKTVSITHNFLEELPPRAFTNLWSEEFKRVNVYFSYNKIQRLDPDTFDQAKDFGDLFLDWNELERANGHALSKLNSVDYLNLDGDSLHCISEVFLTTVLNKTKTLSVKGNPLKCECLEALKKRSEEVKTVVELFGEQTVDC